MNMKTANSRTSYYEKKISYPNLKRKPFLNGESRHLRRWDAVDQWAAECRKQLM